MRVVVWNLKGGQGKTVLSLNLAMLEGMFVVTNDVHSPIDDVLGEDRALRMSMRDPLPQVPPDVSLIYDFGGYPDARIIEAAKTADHILIPIIYESPLEMQVTINAIAEIERYNPNITILLNKSKAGDFERATEVLGQFYSYPIMEIKQSTAFTRSIEQKKSLKQLVDESPLFSFHYSKPLEQLRNILDHVRTK
jgi:cellulose biosynthesis protein BcsQ